MKNIYLAAAALTLSTSAYAWTPGAKADGEVGDKQAEAAKLASYAPKGDMAWGKSGSAKAQTASLGVAGKAMMEGAKLASHDVANAKPLEGAKMAWSGEGLDKGASNEVKLASVDEGMATTKLANSKMGWLDGDRKLTGDAKLASLDGGYEKMPMAGEDAMAKAAFFEGAPHKAASNDIALASLGKGRGKVIGSKVDAKVQAASADTASKPAPAETEQEMSGMGGPLEEIASTGAAALTPQPAAKGYEPCAPGAGDDNCIQLYEPGVKTALAQWTAPGGGLWTGDMAGSATAMGGPYEPVGKQELSAIVEPS